MKNFKCNDCSRYVVRDNISDYWDYPCCEKCQDKVTRDDKGNLVKEENGRHSELL